MAKVRPEKSQHPMNRPQFVRDALGPRSPQAIAGVRKHHADWMRQIRRGGYKVFSRKQMMEARFGGPPKRKSATGGGGEVQVSAYERDGHPVSAYTRSKPSR